MASNRRKFRRVAAGVRVLYSGTAVDRHTREYLEGIARALSTTVADLYSEDGRPVSGAQIAQDESPQLAEKLRPYLGKDSNQAAESVKSFDKAAKSLRKLKSEE